MNWGKVFAIASGVVLVALAAGMVGLYSGRQETIYRLHKDVASLRDSASAWRKKASTAQAYVTRLQSELDQYRELIVENNRKSEELQQLRATHDRQIAIAESQVAEFQRFWSYRSPMLTDAVREFAAEAHKLEDSYNPDNENHLMISHQASAKFGLTVMDAIKKEGWPLLPNGVASTAPSDPYAAMRAMADSLRKHEAGDIDAATFIEKQADFLESINQATREQ